MNRKELKELSRSQLKGKWKVPVLLTLVFFLITIITTVIQENSNSNLVTVLGFIAQLGLQIWAVVGLCKFFLVFSNNNGNAKFEDVLVSKSQLLKSLGYTISMTILGGIIGAIIGASIVSTCMYAVFNYGSFGVVGWIGIIISIALVILIVVIELAIAMAPYLYVDKENVGVFEAIAISARMMKGNKWNLFVIQLSFIGWAILSVLTFGIGFLWLSPYISLTTTNFYKDLNSKYSSYTI